MPGLLNLVDLESIIIFFREFDCYRLPISIDINHRLYRLISDIDFYRLTTPGGLLGRLHISISTKYQSIKNTYCSFRFLCHPACLKALVSTVHPVVTAKLSLFPPGFGKHMIYFDFKFSEAVFKRQSLEAKERNKVLF